MSPTKRAFSEEPESFSVLSPKRLRGGADADQEFMDDNNNDQLYDDDDDEELIAADIDADDMIPEDIAREASRIVPDAEKQRWTRPDVPVHAKTNANDLNLQWLDMDCITGQPLQENPNKTKQPNAVIGRTDGLVPILRTFGVNETGNSVAVFIHGFSPYVYFALPPGHVLIDASTKLGEIQEELQVRLRNQARNKNADDAAVLMVKYVDDHKSVMGYDTPHTKFLKVYVSLPEFIAPLKRVMEQGIDLPGIVSQENSNASAGMMMMPCFEAFEANVPFELRFMVDRDIQGAGWLSLPANTYQVRPEGRKETHCQVRVCASLR
jgi:DNA polymerase delta subunit 1